MRIETIDSYFALCEMRPEKILILIMYASIEMNLATATDLECKFEVICVRHYLFHSNWQFSCHIICSISI